MAGVEHRDAITQVECFFLLVRDEHRGDPHALDELPQLAPRALAQRRIEVRQRLIEQQHARLRREGARERHPLLLSPGKLVNFAAFEAGEIHEVQHSGDLRITRIRSRETEAYVLADVEVRKQRIMLEHHPAATAGRRNVRYIFARDGDPSAVRRLESAKQPQHRRLAAARRTEEGKDFAAGDVERDRADRHAVSPSLFDRVDFEKAAQRRLPSRCPVPRTCWSHQRIHSGPCSARRFQSTSATTMRRRTSRTQSGSESAGRSSRAGNRYTSRAAASCISGLPTKSTKPLAAARCFAPRTTAIPSSIATVPLFGKTYPMGMPRRRLISTSGRSQTVSSPSWRAILSLTSAGFCSYAFVWPSSRRSQAKPAAVSPVCLRPRSMMNPKTARIVPLASGSRMMIFPVHLGSSKSSQSRGASWARTTFSGYRKTTGVSYAAK